MTTAEPTITTHGSAIKIHLTTMQKAEMEPANMKNTKCNIQRWSLSLRQGKTKNLMEERTVNKNLVQCSEQPPSYSLQIQSSNSHSNVKAKTTQTLSTLYIVKNHLLMVEILLTHPSTPAH